MLLIEEESTGLVGEGLERTERVELEETESRADEAAGTRLLTLESTFEGEEEGEEADDDDDGGAESGEGNRVVDEEGEGGGDERGFSWMLADKGPTPITASTV